MIKVKATMSMTAIPELGAKGVGRDEILEVDGANPRVQALIRAGYLSEIPGVSDDALGVTGRIRVSLPRLVAGVQRPQEKPVKKEVTDGDSSDLPAGGERVQPVGDLPPRPQDS